MGVKRFLCRVSNPVYLAKDMRKAIIEEGSVSKGLKQIGKETLMDQVPFADIIHKQGEFAGERKGREKNSITYEDKFNEQMEYFREQKQIYETEIDSLNILLDECEIRISQYESKYGTDIKDIPEEDKEKLLKLYSDQRKLEQLKKQEFRKEKAIINVDIVREFIIHQIGLLEEKTFKWYDSIEKIEDINRKMCEYKDECVLGCSLPLCKLSSKKGIIFGIKGFMYLEEDRYVKYKHISEIVLMKFPMGLKIDVTENRSILAENYISPKLVEVINSLRILNEETIGEMENEKRKAKENTSLKRMLESAWKMSEYPGELVVEEQKLNEWYTEYSAVGGFTDSVSKSDITGKFRHNNFTLVFACGGFIILYEKEPIYILYVNIDTFSKDKEVFTINLIDGSVIEIDKVNTKFLNLTFKRIMEFYRSKEYYKKTYFPKVLSYDELETMETKSAP